MYIKLIQPKMKKRPMDTNLKMRMSPPLGLLTIVNLLREKHKVVIENENIEKITYDNPDIVGISVTVDTLPRAIDIAKRFRAAGTVTVAGGIHITTAYQTVPEGSFDVLCIGAAEGTWHDIVNDFQNNCLKPVYRCRKDVGSEDIVSPAYDFINKKEYLYCNIVHTSRGCPFKCDFCYNSALERVYINRKIDDVISDIEAVGSKHIMFIDDNFTGNIEWTKEFLERIKPLNIKWNAATSINVAYNTELLDLMRESGCQGLFIGFESIDPSSISGVHKIQNNTSKYEQAIKAIHDRDMMINASFVFGFDGDTTQTFKATLDFIVKNKLETVTSHILTPYPGTALYGALKKEGRIITDDFSLYNTANVVFEPKNMTGEELYKGYLWMYKKIYSWKNIFRRLPKNKKQRKAYLLFNIFYRKYGKCTDLLCRLITYRRIGIMAEKISKYL